MELKGILKKAGGLLFEDVGGTLEAAESSTIDSAASDPIAEQLRRQAMTIDQINKGMPGPNTSSIEAPQAPIDDKPAAPQSSAPLVSADGKSVDFTPVYRGAGVPEAPFTAEELLKMLADLGDQPMVTKRIGVGAVLNTMAKTTPGVTSASIANDAMLKVKVLDDYAEKAKAQLSEFVTARQLSIEKLKAEIAAEEAAVQRAQTKVEQMVGWCEAEGEKLDDVLEFFSKDEGGSKLAAQTVDLGLK